MKSRGGRGVGVLGGSRALSRAAGREMLSIKRNKSSMFNFLKLNGFDIFLPFTVNFLLFVKEKESERMLFLVEEVRWAHGALNWLAINYNKPSLNLTRSVCLEVSVCDSIIHFRI